MKTLRKDLTLLILFVISAFMVMCSNSEREIEYTYRGVFPLATQVDLGDPVFYKITKYYTYSNELDLEENAIFDPITLAPYFIGVFEHDSLLTQDNVLVEIKFKSKKHVSSGIMFASGSNRFNNTRFSAGEKFIVRVME